jgi:citrate lyase subunit beta/citryl-CoA lyase
MKRSLLFIPGNRPNMIQNGLVLPADALIFDLEDSVLEEEKDAARTLVASALSSLDFGSKALVVRMNDMSSPHALKDIQAVVQAGCESILLPKTEHAHDISELDRWLDTVEQEAGIPTGSTSLILLIETALGVEKAYELAKASKRVKALALGAEDLAANLGCERTGEGTEILYSRTRLVIAARAAGVEVFDTPFTDAYDEGGCFLDTVFAKKLGFDGKLCISPHHLAPIHKAFTPSQEALENALEVQQAMQEAQREGRGAVALRGRMIDMPVLKQAKRVIQWAKASGMLKGEVDDESGQ